MAKKASGSSARGGRRKGSASRTKAEDIDFSDIPELTRTQLKKARRVGRPNSADPKQLIAIRLSPKLLDTLRKMAKKKGRPYQSLMHELLERAVKDAA